MGAGLVCRALAIADSSVLSEHAGPTAKERKLEGMGQPCNFFFFGLQNESKCDKSS